MYLKCGFSLTTVALVLLISGSVFGFDGERKGFVMGAGLGGTPYVTATNSDVGVDLSTEATAAHFVVGYAWNDHNMLVFDVNFAAHDEWYPQFENVYVSLGFGGFSWYHYYGSRGNSLFSTVGVGRYIFGTELNGEDSAGSGFGYLLGGGYEFTKQVQIGAYLIGGQSDSSIGTNGHNQVNILLTVVAY